MSSFDVCRGIRYLKGRTLTLLEEKVQRPEGKAGEWPGLDEEFMMRSSRHD